ncbi:energy transducer TonB [Methylocapsa polymorpha]|uniref:Energy transducer TonB n=1 Tax=Methylocapsa polymorpha TaxID=3080828 RepID=A0ABZ0HWE0_9HYPH|nr:energy transducer TonB [Methylocapsa sp. RX1]
MTIHAPAILHVAEDRSIMRWIAAGAFVVLAHGGLIYWLTHRHEVDAAEAAAPAVMIDLAPLEIAPPAETMAEVPPGPKMTEAQPEEVEPPEDIAVPELPPAPKPEAVLATAPKPKLKPPKKIVKEPPKPVVKQAHEPPAPHERAARSASPQSSAVAREGASGSSMSTSNWRSLVLAQLNQHKPGAAHEAGTVSLSFTINRGGHVVAARVAGSSGSAALDQAALAMVHNASPLPPPPAEIGGGSISLTVPVRFH